MKLSYLKHFALFLVMGSTLFSCNDDTTDGDTYSSLSDEQQEFYDELKANCGKAFEGELADATPYYAPDFEEVDEIVFHIHSCDDELIHNALHVNDDRSRNLMLTKTDGTLQLKHDHRYEDGSEEEISQYGGLAPQPGLSTRQIFEADAQTEEILPDRFDNFWFLDFMDEDTFAYGVHWPREGHSIRIEFDLSNPVDAPPDPWGYDD